MKKIGADFFRKAQFPFLIALGTAPFPLMLLSPYGAGLWLRVGTFAAVYAALAILCLLAPGKIRLAAGIVGAALLLGLGFLILPILGHGQLILIPALYIAALLSGLPMAAWPREKEISLLWTVAGVLLHGAAQVLVNIGRKNGALPTLLQAAPGLTVCLLSFLLLAMLSLNRASVGEAGMGRHATPRSMRLKNVALTAGFLALGALIACIPGVVRALQGLWAWIKGLLRRAAMWLMSLGTGTGPVESGGGGDGGMPDLAALGEAGEGSPILMQLERVLVVLSLIAAAVGAAFAVKFLAGRIRRLVRYLRDRMRQYAAAAGEDYVDEVTDTREGGEASGTPLLGRLRLNLGDDRRLPPGLRIRRRYLRLRLRHGNWHASQTARETLPDAAARLYERARYSDHAVTEEEARAFEQETRRI